ncbi:MULTISPECIES: DUF6022 family protein [Bacillus]|uniref:DUF6022 family protein n=1 Tax=Bacillus TaxID=1386 RepID=UPI000422E451|nr:MULTISPECIES: DUF6022 family protein [Bacillus]QHZ45565.1 hypothetical protein M654_004205 [Bacillus sp. NSP9.1]
METIRFRQDMSMKEIGEQVQSYVDAHWKQTLEDHRDEFLKAFPELEDATYGLYLDKLLPPVFASLEQSGFTMIQTAKKGDFFIGKGLNFRQSMEKWGAENCRSRVFWTVIGDQQQHPVGTLLFDFYHSHAGFDVPLAPKIDTLEETAREPIVAAIKQIKQT